MGSDEVTPQPTGSASDATETTPADESAPDTAQTQPITTPADESTADTAQTQPSTTPADESAADTTQTQPSTPKPPAAPAVAVNGGITRGRLILVDAIVAVATLLLVVGIFSVWANRLLFNPDNWSNTSTQLLQNQNIRSSTANYVVDQIYANVDVAGLIRSGLPPQLQALASPAAGAVRNLAVQGVELALTRPRVQSLWATANRAADQAFIYVVNGGKGAVSINQGVVTLNLGSIVDNVAGRLGLPANLGAKLPANVANLTVLKSNQIKLVQKGGKAIKGLALWLTILVPLLYILAIFLARGHRRRTLMTVGFAGVLAGVIVLFGRSIMESQIPGSLTNDASLKPTITAVITISTQLLSEVAGGVIFIGVPLVIAAWFAGPARPAVASRRSISPWLREHAVESYALTLAVMVIIFIWDPIPATGKPIGIIVLTALALLGMYVLRAQTAREFPDTKSGETMARIRARTDAARKQRQQRHGTTSASASAPSASGMPEQLRQLADLRDHGELTADEYQAAKAKLLQG